MKTEKTLARHLIAALTAAIVSLFSDHAVAADMRDLRAGAEASRAGEFGQAIEYLSRAIASGDLGATDMSYALRLRGDAYLMAGRYDESISDFTRLIALKPSFSDGYLLRGAAYAAKYDNLSALADYDGAARAEPDSAPAHGRRCEGLAYLDRMDEALEACNRAISIRVNDADYYFLRASVYITMDDPEKAEDDIATAMRLEPADHAAYIRRGTLRQELESWDEALSDFDRAIELAPDAMAGYFARANFYDAAKQYPKAVEGYTTVLEMEPDHSVSYNNRCYVLAKMERIDEAISDCDKAIEMQAENPAYLDSRAYAYLRAGDYEKAIEDYDAAISVFPQFSYALYGRGVAKLRLGDERGGHADISAAVDIDPEIEQRMEEIDIRI
jgi:tetratricopeptide (TPR) repeat protein